MKPIGQLLQSSAREKLSEIFENHCSNESLGTGGVKSLYSHRVCLVNPKYFFIFFANRNCEITTVWIVCCLLLETSFIWMLQRRGTRSPQTVSALLFFFIDLEICLACDVTGIVIGHYMFKGKDFLTLFLTILTIQ